MAENMLWGFWFVSLSLTVTPGADWAYVMSAGIQKRVSVALLGMLLGYLVVIFTVAAGVGALVAANPALLTILTLIGAVYLGWLGMQLLLHPPVVVEGQSHTKSARRWVIQGVAVSGLNPKVLLMFLALVPQFFTPSATVSMPLQTIILGALHIINCALIYPLVGVGIGIVLKHNPRFAQGIGRFSGCSMILIALLLMGEQIWQ